MKTIILASICFDFNGSKTRYYYNCVEDVFLGICDLEDEDEIKAYGQKLLEDYCDNTTCAVIEDSTLTIKKM
jgi:hypothetical protein